MATFDELLNNIGSNPKIRAFGTFAEYKPDTDHKDVIYLATDEGKLYLNGEAYGDSEIPVISVKNYTYSLKDISGYPKFEDQHPFPNHLVIDEKYLEILQKKPVQVIFDNSLEKSWYEDAEGNNVGDFNRSTAYMPNYLLGTLTKDQNNILTYRIQSLSIANKVRNEDRIITGDGLNYHLVDNILDQRDCPLLGVSMRDPKNYPDQAKVPFIGYPCNSFFIGFIFNLYIDRSYSENEVVDDAFKVISTGVQGFFSPTLDYTSSDKEYSYDPYYTDSNFSFATESSALVKYGVDVSILNDTVLLLLDLLRRRAIQEEDDYLMNYGGLGLSRNNFTDAFKDALTPLLPAEGETEPQKVLSDNNYSDEDKQVVDNAKTFLEATDPEDTTINRWKEVEAFLNGVTDTETLTGLLEDIQNAAAADATAKANAIKAELDTLKADYDTLKEEHEQLMTDFNTLKTNFETFQTNVTTLFNDLYRIVEDPTE